MNKIEKFLLSQEYGMINQFQEKSVVELILKTITKLNEIIDITTDYTEIVEGLQNWFNTLDITDEVHSKLDLMLANGQLIELLLRLPYKTVKWYGAKGDGITDDTNAIKQALLNEKVVVFPQGEYKITSPIHFGNVEIIGYNATVYFDDSFVKGNTLPSNEFALYNTSFKTSYDKPNTFKIKNMKFENRTTLGSQPNIPYSIMGIANTLNCVIDGCSFESINITNVGVVGFDGYSSNRNLTFKNNRVILRSGSPYGGVWFRNLGTGYSENIIIENNYIENNQNDEALAVYGYQGGLKNVKIINNHIEHKGNSNNVLTIGANDPTVAGGSQSSFIENVVVEGNIIIAHNCSSKVIQISMEAESLYIRNILLSNNIIRLIKGASTTRIINTYRGSNVKIIGNIISNEGDVYVIGLTASTPTEVINNTISGKYSIVASWDLILIGNVLNVNVSQQCFYNAVLIKDNKIYPQSSSVICRTDESYMMVRFIGNYIDTTFANHIVLMTHDNKHLIKDNVVIYRTTGQNGYLVYVERYFNNKAAILNNMIFGSASTKLTPNNGAMIIANNTFIE